LVDCTPSIGHCLSQARFTIQLQLLPTSEDAIPQSADAIGGTMRNCRLRCDCNAQLAARALDVIRVVAEPGAATAFAALLSGRYQTEKCECVVPASSLLNVSMHPGFY